MFVVVSTYLKIDYLKVEVEISKWSFSKISFSQLFKVVFNQKIRRSCNKHSGTNFNTKKTEAVAYKQHQTQKECFEWHKDDEKYLLMPSQPCNLVWN